MQQPELCDSNLQPQILQCLQLVLSHDPLIQSQAETLLSQLGHNKGFSSALVAIISSTTADHSARWLASVHLKNCVSKNWRHRPDQGGISPEEKIHLRQSLLSLVLQEDPQVTVQIALAISRIARVDYPREWPCLFSDLLGKLPNSSAPLVERVYFTLHHILKELSSKRLASDQKIFAEATASLFDHVWQQWCSDTQAILSNAPSALQQYGSNVQAIIPYFERWLVLLKILRRLIVFGYPSDAKYLQPVGVVQTCAPAVLQAAQALLTVRSTAAVGNPQVLALVDRSVLKLVKTLCQVQEAHPWSFHHCGALRASLELCCGWLSAAAPGGDSLADRALLRCIVLLVCVLRCPSYRGQATALGGKGSQGQAAELQHMSAEVQAALAAFFTPDNLVALVKIAVHKYFPLTLRELEEWQSDPEQFFHSSDSSAWQEHPRLAAQNLYLTLMQAHRETLAPLVVELLKQASEAAPAPGGVSSSGGVSVCGVPSTLLAKEAAYTAVAVGAYDLHDYLDFNPWLRGALLPELAVTEGPGRVLCRGACHVVSAWAASLGAEERPALYIALCSLLTARDACVRLSGVAALRTLVDDWAFEGADFAPCVQHTMAALADMLEQSAELDTHTQVFELLNLLLERAAEAVRPQLSDVALLLPRVWRNAQGQSLLRIQVLCAMQRLFNLVGGESPALYPLALPILAAALSPRVSAEPEVVEDALALWLVALRNAPQQQQQQGQQQQGQQQQQEQPLLELLPLVIDIMAESTEHILLGMQALSSAMLLGGTALLHHQGSIIASLLFQYIGAVSERGMLLALRPMDLVLAMAGQLGAELLAPGLAKLLGLVLAGSEAPTVVAAALALFARVVLTGPDALQAVLAAAVAAGVAPGGEKGHGATAGAASGEQLLGALLDVWMDNFDSVAAAGQRRLCALGACHVLALPSRAPLSRLALLLGHISAVWAELEGPHSAAAAVGAGRDDEGATRPYAIDYTSVSRGEEGELAAVVTVVDSEDAAGESERRAALRAGDPANSVTLSAALREGLSAAATLHGDAFNSAMAQVDPAVQAQLAAMMQR